MFPKEKIFPDLIPHFPTRWQAVVFRNYGIVPVSRIAAVLSASEEDIREAACMMGLEDLRDGKDFRTDAYLTVLRSNWHLLNYKQLMELMEIDEKKLNAYLYEDDFCSVKLGDKPILDDVVYAPLSREEMEKTQKIGKSIQKAVKIYSEPPFAFRNRFSGVPFENEGIFLDCVFPGCNDYIAFWKQYYDLSFLKGKKVVCRMEDRENWKEEDFSVIREGEEYFVDAKTELGVLRGLQYLAENPNKKHIGEKHSFFLDDRIIYSYFATCGDILLEGGDCCYPDGLLAELAKRKINGIWLNGILRQLTPFDWESSYSKDCEIRLKNLNTLIKRAKRYGIKVWLYLNEPRSMPLSFFERFPELLGGTEGEFGALCTSRTEVTDWLAKSSETLFSSCPELGGVITITMSENLTNCFSRVHTVPFNCPHCKNRSAEEAAAQVNRIFQKAIDKTGSAARLIVWTWGWAEYMKWDEKAVERGLSYLDEKSIVMCTSEDSLRVVKGNTFTEIIDYTMSNIGPSEKTVRIFEWLKNHNRTGYVKVQVNNTWECAAVPYIPVFPSIETHIRNLLSLGARGILLSWTLGGYPTITLDLVAQCISESHFCLRDWFDEVFKEDGRNEKMFSACLNCKARILQSGMRQAINIFIIKTLCWKSL